jgi:DNA polymerase-2
MRDTPIDITHLDIDCFLLTARGRDAGGRFEVVLWGAAGSGERVRVFDGNFRPMFFCLRETPAEAAGGAVERRALPLRSFGMRDVDCLYFGTHAAMLRGAAAVRGAGYPVYESDVYPLARYLMERMVSGSMRVSGAARREGRFLRFDNPRLRGCGFVPDLRVMSVWVDDGGGGGAIRGVACVEAGHERLFASADERGLLADFMAHVRARDPDVLTGPGIAGSALRALAGRCEKLGLRFDIGREAGCAVSVSTRNVRRRDGGVAPRQVWSAYIPGRAVMDLEAMARAYGRGGGEFHIDAPDALSAAKAALELFEGAEILPNAIESSRRNGRALGETGGSVASFDHLYLPRLHRAGFVAGDTADIPPPAAPLPGGHVLEPAPGLYENVLVFDFKSLYPSIIMTFMIDPLGFRVTGGKRISTPIGTSFSREASVMPGIIRELMEARALAAQLGNPYLSQAIKLLMNSFAGVLASTGCRFFSEDVSRSITLTGQHILKTSVERIESVYGKKAIYGDTDSIFVCLGPGAEGGADALGARISAEAGVWLREALMERYGAKSALELKYEGRYRHFFIPPLRGGDAGHGAKKHYCGASVDADGRMELTFKGMESARGDWTELAKEFQRELFLRFFSGEPLDGYVAATAGRLTRGEFDEKLIYMKHVRKGLDDYTANAPPHVQAARMLDEPVGTVKYCVTKSGPQPVEKLTAPLDYRHYLDCQLRPVADSILAWLGSDFDSVVSGQQELFG